MAIWAWISSTHGQRWTLSYMPVVSAQGRDRQIPGPTQWTLGLQGQWETHPQNSKWWAIDKDTQHQFLSSWSICMILASTSKCLHTHEHTQAFRWLLVLLWRKAFIWATELVETWLPLNFSIFSPQWKVCVCHPLLYTYVHRAVRVLSTCWLFLLGLI